MVLRNLVLVGSFLLATGALAQTCSMLTFEVDEARTQLKKTMQEADFDSAKDFARRAKGALEDVSLTTSMCGCMNASFEFDDAASKARRARDANEVDDFKTALRGAVRAFNNGIEAINYCASSRR